MGDDIPVEGGDSSLSTAGKTLKRPASALSLKNKRKASFRQDFDGLYITIPTSLVAVAPFLEEGLHVLRKDRKIDSSGEDLSKGVTGTACILALTCFKHAFAFLHTYNIALDDAALKAMVAFKKLAEDLSTVLYGLHVEGHDLSNPIEELPALLKLDTNLVVKQNKIKKSEETYRLMVVAEAKLAIELAEKEKKLGLLSEAAKLYHTACIYLSMVGPLSPELDEMLRLATAASKMCGSTAENFIHENFSGEKFSEKYEDKGKLIGQGAFGAVRTCTLRTTGDLFARKEIGLTTVKPYNIHVLHSEIQIMKVLDHPNIVKLREVFFEPQRVYLVMDLCNGGDLKNYLKSYGVQGDVQVARMMKDMMSAVYYLHEHGIVHRDLKLENFIFESTSRDSPLKLIDFGLSKYLDESELLGALVGTPYYVAPEVWNDKYDEKCDHWALGVCAYTLLVGEFPFDASTVEDLKLKVKYSEPSYAHLRPTTESFLRILLNKNPSERAEFSACFEHPFMTRISSFVSSEAPEPNSANSLLKYLHMSETRKLLLKAVGFCLSPAQIAKLKRGFEEIDENRNGVICVQELKTAIERQYSQGMHFSFSQEEMREMFANVDKLDSNMEFNYSEFLAAALHRQLVVEEERLKEAFKKLDPQCRGYLTREDLKLALGHKDCVQLIDTVCNEMPTDAALESKLDTIFDELDSNKDGIIEYYEFLQFWRAFNEKTRTETIGLNHPKQMERGTFGGIGLFKAFK